MLQITSLLALLAATNAAYALKIIDNPIELRRHVQSAETGMLQPILRLLLL
jgi:hypothetical protein